METSFVVIIVVSIVALIIFIVAILILMFYGCDLPKVSQFGSEKDMGDPTKDSKDELIPLAKSGWRKKM